jgi:hypothetical protein
MSRIGQAVFELQEKDDQNWMQQHEKIIRPIQAPNAAASDCGWLGRSALVQAASRGSRGVRAVGGGVQLSKD